MSKQKDGQRKIILCSDIDQCGHTTIKVVADINKSFERMYRLVPGLRLILLEDDAVREGSVQGAF